MERQLESAILKPLQNRRFLARIDLKFRVREGLQELDPAREPPKCRLSLEDGKRGAVGLLSKSLPAAHNEGSNFALPP